MTSFTPSPSSASAGVPIVFTVTPAAGANIGNVHVDFGDGSSTDLGSIGAATPVPHTYNRTGNYTATATVSGDGGSLSANVIIGALGVTLTASPGTGTVNSPVTFTVSGVASAQVDHYVFTFDDGEVRNTSSPQTTKSFTSKGQKTIRVDVFGVGGGQIGTNTLVMEVQ